MVLSVQGRLRVGVHVVIRGRERCFQWQQGQRGREACAAMTVTHHEQRLRRVQLVAQAVRCRHSALLRVLSDAAARRCGDDSGDSNLEDFHDPNDDTGMLLLMTMRQHFAGPVHDVVRTSDVDERHAREVVEWLWGTGYRGLVQDVIPRYVLHEIHGENRPLRPELRKFRIFAAAFRKPGQWEQLFTVMLTAQHRAGDRRWDWFVSAVLDKLNAALDQDASRWAPQHVRGVRHLVRHVLHALTRAAAWCSDAHWSFHAPDWTVVSSRHGIGVDGAEHGVPAVGIADSAWAFVPFGNDERDEPEMILSILEACASGGSVPIMRHLLAKHAPTPSDAPRMLTEYCWERAVLHNRKDMVQFLIATAPLPPDRQLKPMLLVQAARDAFLDIVRLLVDHALCRVTLAACFRAARDKQYAILKYYASHIESQLDYDHLLRMPLDDAALKVLYEVRLPSTSEIGPSRGRRQRDGTGT